MSGEQQDSSTGGKAPSKRLKASLAGHKAPAVICPVCEKTFRSYYNLKIHIRIHTGEKLYACELCRKRFTESGTLKKHLRTHTGEKPYVCGMCEKAFSQISHLNIHHRRHTGERPYSCVICQKTFTQLTELKTHLRVHTQEKPFVCDVCQKGFQLQCGLKYHSFKHAEEKPFSCDQCTKKFFVPKQLASHIRNIHEKKNTGSRTRGSRSKQNRQFNTGYRKIFPAPLKESPPVEVSSNESRMQRNSLFPMEKTNNAKPQPRFCNILPAGSSSTSSVSVPFLFLVTPQLPQQQITVPFL